MELVALAAVAVLVIALGVALAPYVLSLLGWALGFALLIGICVLAFWLAVRIIAAIIGGTAGLFGAVARFPYLKRRRDREWARRFWKGA